MLVEMRAALSAPAFPTRPVSDAHITAHHVPQRACDRCSHSTERLEVFMHPFPRLGYPASFWSAWAGEVGGPIEASRARADSGDGSGEGFSIEGNWSSGGLDPSSGGLEPSPLRSANPPPLHLPGLETGPADGGEDGPTSSSAITPTTTATPGPPLSGWRGRPDTGNPRCARRCGCSSATAFWCASAAARAGAYFSNSVNP